MLSRDQRRELAHIDRNLRMAAWHLATVAPEDRAAALLRCDRLLDRRLRVVEQPATEDRARVASR